VTDYDTLIPLLVENDIEFIIVGGAAATAHGSSRLTLDLDIVYSRKQGNIARIVKALTPLKPYLRGAPIGLPFEWSVETLNKGLNFTLITTLGALDLLGEMVEVTTKSSTLRPSRSRLPVCSVNASHSKI